VKRDPLHNCRNIAIALIDTEKGEGKAQDCDIACSRQLRKRGSLNLPLRR
jgi:hypothetical protein